MYLFYLKFQKCTVDGIAVIQEFMSKSEKTFVKAFINAQEGSNKSLAERRFKLAARYYYIMLDTFLKKVNNAFLNLFVYMFIYILLLLYINLNNINQQ